SPSGPVYQAGTLSGNPLAMTAGVWGLCRLSTKLYRRLADLGAMLADGVARAAREAGVGRRGNAIGSLVAAFFSSLSVPGYSSALHSDTVRYAAFFKGMLARGVYPPPSQFEAWFLSGAHTRSDVERTIQAAHEAMHEVARLG